MQKSEVESYGVKGRFFKQPSQEILKERFEQLASNNNNNNDTSIQIIEEIETLDDIDDGNMEKYKVKKHNVLEQENIQTNIEIID